MTNRVTDDGVVIADTVTVLGPECDGRVVIGSSHGGVYATYLAAKAKARGIILNDAGRGKDDAGIGGGTYASSLGIPYATVDTMTCKIGNGESAAEGGIISFANDQALGLGVSIGMSAMEAARLMSDAKRSQASVPAYEEARTELPAPPNGRGIVLMDSISLVREGDEDKIVVSGSHGAMLGSDPSRALKQMVHAAFFNDAGGGKDLAGVSRLGPLAEWGIPAGTVAAMSARIGDGRSTYEDGVLSHINKKAEALGAAVGMPAKTFIDALAEPAAKQE